MYNSTNTYWSTTYYTTSTTSNGNPFYYYQQPHVQQPIWFVKPKPEKLSEITEDAIMDLLKDDEK